MGAITSDKAHEDIALLLLERGANVDLKDLVR
jgi:hypothetical protein